ncbi:MAG: 50S ribosomal protein L30, partial [Candidatus Aenigmatarchaeota archaeon]
MSQNNAPLYIVVRIKGQQGLHPDVKKTLELLRLHKKFHVVLVRANESMKGMLKKVEHTITYGEAEPDTIALLLERRGRIEGGKRLTIDY